MTGFLIGAALLLVVALAFVLPPLLRKEEGAALQARHDQLNLAVLRDQLRELDADLAAGTIDRAAYESARHDLEQRVLDEVQPQTASEQTAANRPWAALAVGLLVPLLAGVMYFSVGEPGGFDPAQQVAQQEDDGHALTQEQIEGMVAGLAKRMESDPGNAEGWMMLARSYNAMGRYEQAAAAYARLVQLVPNDAAVLADYADTLAMATNRSLQGEPEQVIERALKVDERNIKALALYGTAAFERGDYQTAITRWQRIVALVPAESDVARSVSASIDEARGKLGKAGPATAGVQASPQQQAAAGAVTVQGTVDLDPALRAQVSPEDTVFIFARAAQGPRFPLAVVRKQVKDLPARFTLDDSMSMTPEVKLSSVSSVVVGARVSRSGNAIPATGDLEGETAPLVPGVSTAALQIRIDKRIN